MLSLSGLALAVGGVAGVPGHDDLLGVGLVLRLQALGCAGDLESVLILGVGGVDRIGQAVVVGHGEEVEHSVVVQVSMGHEASLQVDGVGVVIVFLQVVFVITPRACADGRMPVSVPSAGDEVHPTVAVEVGQFAHVGG